MKLGISWFDYEPQWKGNRDLPEGERLKLQIRRLRPVDLYGDENDERLIAWRDKVLKPQYEGKEEWESIETFPAQILGIYKRLTTHTRNWQGFEFEDGVKTDPVDIALNLPTPTGLDQTEGVIWEIISVLNQTANLNGDELKNFDGPAAGGHSEQESNAQTV